MMKKDLVHRVVMVRLWHGDCLERLRDLSDGVVEAILCDPPYD